MMNKRFCIAKLLPVWCAISAVIVIAGIIVFALFGFSYASSEYKTVEVTYNAVVTINEKEEDLQNICESTFTEKGLSYSQKDITDSLSSTYLSKTGEIVLTYTFSGNSSDESLNAAVTAIKTRLSENELYTDIAVSRHSAENVVFYESVWRGAIAIAVGAVVALVYIGIRFGVASALTGLAACVHDVLLTLAILALVRIPLYAYTPLLFAAIAALLSLLFWVLQCMKRRENFKDPAYVALSAEEAVAECYKTSKKTGLIAAGVLVVILAILGAVASAGVRLFMLPAIVPVVVCAYSSLVFATSLFVPVKAKFDKIKSKHKRYEGKKKAEKAEA